VTNDYETVRRKAVDVCLMHISSARDWQVLQHVLADHPTLGPWLDAEFGDDVLSEIESIVREAELEAEDRGIRIGY
jgi:hypothetical protein